MDTSYLKRLKMKNSSSITKSLALLISLELILSPLPVTAKDEGSPIAETLGVVLNTASSIYNSIQAQNRPPSPQMVQNMDLLKRQQTPTGDKFFNPQKMSQIPGLNEYLAINGINPQSLMCTTLPTTLTEINTEVCRTGIKSTTADPVMQDMEAQMFAQQYSAIDKMYRNFSTQTNTGGELFGVGCMKNASDILNGFFKSRIDELDKLTTNIEAIQNGFIEASKMDLESIKESTALLEGSGSEIANEVQSKNPTLLDFGKKFDNPSCGALFTKEQFTQKGKKGLNGINAELQKAVSEKRGPMGFSADSYALAHQGVLQDINSLADKVAKQMELNFQSIASDSSKYSSNLSTLGKSVGSSNKLNNILTPDLFSDVQTKFQKRNDELRTLAADIQSELGGSANNALGLMAGTNSAAFEAEVATLDRNIKNNCVNKQAQLDTVLEKIYDPSATGFANRNASNFLKDKIKQIMTDQGTTLDKKLAELKALESQQGNRYLVRMESSYEVQEVDAQGNLKTKVVPASTNRTPGVFFSDVIRNCEAQFKANTLNNKMTGATALKKLRQLHQDYKSLAKTHSEEVKKEIRNRLTNCDAPTKANASIPGSCSSQAFDTSSSGFCAANAFACSSKMKECSKQAEKIVEQVKTDRTARVRNYKAMAEKNKQDMVRLFDTALSKYMRDGELLRGAFGAGFTSPAGIQRQVPEGQQYLSLFQQATQGSVDGTLLLEDPAKFTQMFKSNIQILKKSVEDQQKQILGGGPGSTSGLLAQHIKETEAKYKQVAESAKQIADQCTSQHDKFAAEIEAQNKKQQEDFAKSQAELGEKTNTFCRKYGLAMTNPGPACSGTIEDTFSGISTLPGGADAVSELERVCAQSGNSEGSSSGDAEVEALKICADYENKPPTKAAEASPPTTTTPAPAISSCDVIEAARKEAAAAKAVAEAKAKEASEADKEAKEAKEAEAAAAKVNAEAAEKSAKKAKEDNQTKCEAESRLVAIAAPAGSGKKGKQTYQEMYDLCDKFTTAQGACVGVEEVSEGKTASCNRNDNKVKQLAETVVEKSGGSVTASEEILPAFCSAGNGSSGVKTFMDAIGQGVQQGMSGGAQGF